MSTLTVPTRNVALSVARVFAGLLGLMKAAGITYFALLAPDEAVWLGPWIDIPAVGTLFAVTVLLLVIALAPGLRAGRRIGLGLLAVGLDVAVTLVKVPLYDEPESVTFLAFDAILLTLLLLARRVR
jgi:hypothetical protein